MVSCITRIVSICVILDSSVSTDVMTFSLGLEKYELPCNDRFCKDYIVFLNIKLFRGLKVGARLLAASPNFCFLSEKSVLADSYWSTVEWD